MDHLEASRRGQQRARALLRDGEHRDAALYQINALAHDPSNAALLAEHVATVFTLVEQSVSQKDHDEALALLDELESRLSVFIGHADPDHIEQVRKQLKAVQVRRAKIDPPSTALVETQTDPETAHMTAIVAEIGRGEWDWSVPLDAKQAIERLSLVSTVAEFVEDGEHKIASREKARLSRQLESLRRAVTADETCTEASQALKEISAETDARVCTAVLQQAEASLRGLLPTVRTIAAARASQVLRTLDAISAALDALNSTERARRSRARWNHLVVHEKEIFEQSHAWKPETTTTPRSDVQAQLARLQKLIEATSEALRELDDAAVRDEALAHLRVLGELASTASAAQREAYNRWALGRIQQAFESAMPHVKVTGDNEEVIDGVLFSNLGDVSPTVLQPEVSRAYSEVLEFFLGKLYAPKKDKGFAKQGARLHLLKRLAEARKVALADF